MPRRDRWLNPWLGLLLGLGVSLVCWLLLIWPLLNLIGIL